MVRINHLLRALALLLCCALPALAQQPAASASNEVVPPMVRFTGVLNDVNGKPLSGVVGVTFNLYKDSEGGTPLWSETQNVWPNTTGHYSVMLGSTTANGMSASLFADGEARWIGVQIEGQKEQPRVILLSVPYAMKAVDAQTLGGLPASAFALANSAQAPSQTHTPAASTSGSKNTPPPNPAITGTGTAGNIPMFDTTTDIINSVMFQKTSQIGIGTTAPAATLDVNGKGDVRDTLTLFPKLTDNTLAVNGTAFKVSSTGLVTFISGQKFPGTGTITGITTAAGSGLSGGGTSGTLSLKVPAAGITNTMLASSKITLNANSAGGITAPGAMTLGGTSTIGLKPCVANQILQYSGTVWNCANAGVGTITGVTTGATSGLTGGGTSGTLNLSIASGGVTNAMLQHSSLTVPAGTGLTGGGLVSLGGTATALAVNPAIVPELATTNAFTNLNAITVNSTSPDLSVTNTSTGSTIGSGNGVSVTVTATGAQAVTASGGYEGFVGSNSEFPIVGYGSEYGVFGESTTDANFIPSIYGYASGTTQATIGVIGLSPSPVGIGVNGVGVGYSTEGTTIAGSGTVGVWGDTNTDMGVLGTADEGNSVAGFNASEPFATGYFENDTAVSATAPVLTAVGGNFGGACMFDVSGDMYCSGSKSAVVPVDNGARKVALYAVESPKNWFEDFGSANLSNGSVVISLESTFAQTVNTASYHVFLTPNGDCKGLYVSQKSAGGFEVRELGGGTSNIAFDYRIVAERRGYENIRMADKTQLFEKSAGLKRSRHPATPLRAPTLKRPEEPARTAVVRPVGAAAPRTR